jgi:hypothetical protein
MTQPLVFISYSHKDEAEKDQLLAHLGVLQQAGLVEVWNDDRIGTGADWESEISRAMAQAKVAVLLISANFLTSDFILRQEVPALLKRRDGEGLTVFPVIARACAWEEVEWLRKMNVRPKNGRPIWGSADSRVDEDLAAIAAEVAAIVKKNAAPTGTSASSAVTPGPPPPVQPLAVDISGNVMIGSQAVNIWRSGVRLARNWLLGKQRLDVQEPPRPDPQEKRKE